MGVPGGVVVAPGVFSPATVAVTGNASLPWASWAASTSLCEPSSSSIPAPAPWSWLSSEGSRDVSLEPGDDGVTTEPSGAYCMQAPDESANTPSPRPASGRSRGRRARVRMDEGYRRVATREYRADADSRDGEPLGEAPTRRRVSAIALAGDSGVLRPPRWGYDVSLPDGKITTLAHPCDTLAHASAAEAVDGLSESSAQGWPSSRRRWNRP